MSLWKLVQQNSEALCSEGLRALLMAEPLKTVADAPETAGVYLFIADPQTYFVAETDNLRKALASQTSASHSSFYRDYRRSAKSSHYQIVDFVLRCLPVSFSRRELVSYAEANVSSLAEATAVNGMSRFAMAGASSMWDRVQGVSDELIAGCGRDVLTRAPRRWGGPAVETGPGLQVIFAPDDEVLYIGESADIAQSYRDHMRSTLTSEFRQNLAERILEIQLASKDGPGRYLNTSEERQLSDFTSTCRISFAPMTAGRLEVQLNLIERMRPVLNISQEKGPYTRMRPLFGARPKKALWN